MKEVKSVLSTSGQWKKVGNGKIKKSMKMEGAKRGKEREKSRERGGRGRGDGGVPAGQRRLAEAAARRPTAGTAPRAAPPLERCQPCAASPVTPASSSPVTPAALPRSRALRALSSLRRACGDPGPPCRWGWGSRCSSGLAGAASPSGDVKSLRPARMELKFL